MHTSKALILFVVGLLLVLIAFPVAFFVSAALSYVLCLIAVGFGAYMIAKRGGRTLPLVLGVLLLIAGVGVFAGTLFIHMTTYAISKAIEEAAKTKYVSASIGEAITIGDWKITVADVKESVYVKSDNNYYSAKNNTKVVVVRLKIENAGREAKSLAEIWSFVLVTNVNKSYERAYLFNLEWIWSPSEEIIPKAISVSALDTSKTLAPGTYSEGDLLFLIPENETPIKLYFKVGIVGPYEVEVKLK